MVRFAGLISVVSILAASPAAADEIRHQTFPDALVGSWAQTSDNCAKGDKSNFTIAGFGYGGPDGNCAVMVVVETAAAKGSNYSVRALCAAGDRVQPAGHIVNLIMRPDGADHVLIGTSFQNLTPYQRCPAK